jgi:hypothetical protein
MPFDSTIWPTEIWLSALRGRWPMTEHDRELPKGGGHAAGLASGRGPGRVVVDAR